MADFFQFVNNETLIVTDPVISKEAVEWYVEKKPSYKKGKISSFGTGKEENPDVWIYCDERHKLDGCSILLKTPCRKGSSFWQNKNLTMDA